jgi:hypothetical protein
MDPLAVVEQQLGSVDIWPSGVLTVMFSGDEPNLRASRRLVAFMYGKGVGASDTVMLFMACQGTNDRWRKMAESQMYGWYMQCGTARNIFYYNMKKYVVVR